ncbi:hypothetical protein [Streptomyces sp. NPDC059092]
MLDLGDPLHLPYVQLVHLWRVDGLMTLTGLLPACRVARVGPVAELGTGE